MPRASLRSIALLLPMAGALCGPARAGAGDATFDVRMGDRALGREEVHAASEALVSSASLQVVPGGPPFRYQQRTDVDAAGAFRRYELTSDTHQVIAEVTSSGVTLAATVVGRRHEKTLPGPGPWLVLDNLVFAHYDLLGRALIAPGAPTSLQVLVPQALVALPATCKVGPGAPVRVAGAARPTREVALTLASVRVVALVDADTGVAYRVEVPAQQLVAVREGVQVEAARDVAGPDPAPKLAGREVEVTFTSPYGQLPGVLTLPDQGHQGPWPAVVLLHGSGPQDRDETIGPNKPFRDLAWQLAGRGVASLRYDKRTYLLGQRLRDPATSKDERQRLLDGLRDMTLEGEVIEDGVAAARWLAARPEVSDVFVLGHSLGGLAAPQVARAVGARGVVLLAGPGRPMGVLLREQLTYQATLAGATPEEAAAAADAQLAPLGEPGAAIDDGAMFMGATGHYWKDLLARDPAADVATLAVPVLVLHAAEDCQVRVADHEALRAAIASAPAAAASRAVLFEGLNHLFMPVEGRSTGADYFEPGTLSPEVSEVMAEWVRQVASTARSTARPGQGDR